MNAPIHVELVDLQWTGLGLRFTHNMSNLDACTIDAMGTLRDRLSSIPNVKRPDTMYGISPPNYKGNPGELDFYVCVEVEPIAAVPPGMVHIRIPERLYTRTVYRGAVNDREAAYSYTSAWLKERGYAYDDVEYYLEEYGPDTRMDATQEESSVMYIYCPVKRP
ncbi:GyrI-like domain-containing protein [Paenibacillus sp. HJGM_3]|uniref:GyrI-like domain-containing protein n=1 Tax=Paenibacillus sp. HJGM_3 TaxID=3379816 RepID=UPI00385FB40B